MESAIAGVEMDNVDGKHSWFSSAFSILRVDFETIPLNKRSILKGFDF